MSNTERHGWTQLTLGDLGKVVTGRTPPSSKPELFGDKYPFITPTDMAFSDRSIWPERGISDAGAESLSRIKLPPKTPCFVCIGATIGKLCLTSEESFTNQQINSIVVDQKKHSPEFVYYLLCYISEQVKSLAGGAATPIINKTAFSEVPVVVPSLETQKAIASVLAAYDDLIENNTRRIEILEEMARRLYEEWFVHFRFPGHEEVSFKESELGDIPEGWEVVQFKDVANNFDRMRKPLSKKQRAERQGVYPYYGAAKVFDYIDDYIFDGRYLLLAEDGSVIDKDGFPVLQMANGKFWANNHTHILQGKSPASTEFLYLALSGHPISGYITGAAQPKITQANMNRIPLVMANLEIHEAFDQLVRPMFDIQETLEKKNANLRAQRDLLLPKLVSGEIDVSNISMPNDKEVEAA